MGYAGLEREPRAVGTTPRGVSRVSLTTGLTGIPLIVLYLKQVTAPYHCELRSLEKAEVLRAQAGDPSDKKAWGYVEAFFQAGGTRAHVLALCFPGENRLESMLGKDGGIARRTGLRIVLDWAEKADLLCVPQATELLAGDAYLGFCQTVFDLTGDALGVLFLMDLPKAMSSDDAVGFASRLFCADAAIFHPWMVVAERAVPPSMILAAWLQKTDAEVGVQEMASQIAVGGGAQPMKAFGPQTRARLLEGRINTFLSQGGETLVWGGYTLADRADWRSRLIPLRRSSSKIRQAVEQLCEPYVLEAAGPELPVWVENSLQNFLRSVRKIFHRDLQDPFTTEVRVVTQEGEERIEVALSYTLPHSLERFSLSFVA